MTLTLAALVLTRLIPTLVVQHVFDLFLGAVFLSAWYVGFGPGAFSAFVSILIIDYFFLPPINSFAFDTINVTRLSAFAVVAFLTSSLSARLRETQYQLQRTHDELEERVMQRTQDLSNTNNRLEEEIAHRLAAEQEILQISNRELRRLGEDLHDGLCQTLVGVRLLSRELKDNLATAQSPWTQDAERIEARLTEALMQADIVSRGLYPVELETNGLMAALQELTQKFSVIHRASAVFICHDAVTIANSSTSDHLYRIAQEALFNAIKRGKAKRIRIRLVKRGARITLSVTDDGIGFKVNEMRHGMGLKIMNYRARMIDADFRIRSRSRGVTRVICAFEAP